MKTAVFSEKGLYVIAKEIKKRLRKDFDVVLAITGYEGSGKSTLAIEIAMLVDPKFSFENNMILTKKFTKIKQTITDLPKYSATLFDEATKQLDKRDWSSSVQKNLNTYFTLFRKENKCHILAIPSFNDLSKNFRERRVYIWIHVLDRGIAIFFKSMDKSPFYAWYFNDMEKMFKQAIEMRKINPTSNEDVANILAKSVHFVCVFPFPHLDPVLEQEYLKWLSQHRDEDLGEIEAGDEVGERYKTFCERVGHLIDLIKTGKITKAMTITKIAKLIGMPNRTLENYRLKYISSREVHVNIKPSREVHVNIKPSREDGVKMISPSPSPDNTFYNNNVSKNEDFSPIATLKEDSTFIDKLKKKVE